MVSKSICSLLGFRVDLSLSGYCSREQRYRPEECAICKAILVGKKYTGFWEGGQGTRDKVRMNRKGNLKSTS